MFNCCMSAEKKFSSMAINPSPLTIPEKSEKDSLSGRVDINTLLNRARKKHEKETRTNLVFFGIFILVIATVAILLTL